MTLLLSLVNLSFCLISFSDSLLKASSYILISFTPAPLANLSSVMRTLKENVSIIDSEHGILTLMK